MDREYRTRMRFEGQVRDSYDGAVGTEVTVVIPVRNDAGGLPNAVQSVMAQDTPADLQVLICVGPSSDQSREVADRLAATDPRICVVPNPKGEIPIALNLGLKNASSPVLVRVDARTVLPSGYIAAALETLSATGAANVGAVQCPVGRSLFQQAVAAAMKSRVGNGGAAYRGATEIQRVDTAFLGVFDAERLRQVGGWDERLLRNEDAELNLRLANRGGVWIDPRMVVEYEPRRGPRALARQYFDYGWWRRATVRMHPRSLAMRQLAGPAITIMVAASALAALFVPVVLTLPALYAAGLCVAAGFCDVPARIRVRVPLALATMHLSWGAGFLISSLAGPRLAKMTAAAEMPTDIVEP